MIEEKYQELYSKYKNFPKEYFIKIDTLNRIPIYIGISSKKLPIFIFEVPYDATDYASILNGTIVYSINSEKATPDSIRYKLEATNDYSCHVFYIVVDDLIQQAEQQTEPYYNTVISRLAMWEDFFKHSASGTLSETEEIGLFGELSFIEEELEKEHLFIINKWCGPLKKAKDFILNDIAIEMKTSLCSDTNRINISDENQLDDTGFSSLFLNMRLLAQNQMDGRSLPEIVDSILCLIKDDASYIVMLKEKLLQVGYKAEFASNYKKKYEVLNSFWYEVKDHKDASFPRIIPADLKKGIKYVKYQIELSELCEFITNKPNLEEIAKRENMQNANN